ncbi:MULTISPECIES: hypothetical protein [Shouchella]|uniref:Uncharacterized protein n=2 Tax=Shouchella TaxID=2893057 RepID=A0ABY7W3D5_9BACI|nr:MULTISPECIES: hypothetical protein [Shouchella]MED4128840.1 hypothetical protein [Shouchella miscanthi]WDF01976.1 hypothetical protein PQ477_10610 [Shouchella hunanensis]GAF20380.1 hypothetical protein JCM19047_9 [Bacillus sp. JCM 19047]
MIEVAVLFAMLLALACLGAPLMKTWKYLMRQMIIGSIVLMAFIIFLFVYEFIEGSFTLF